MAVKDNENSISESTHASRRNRLFKTAGRSNSEKEAKRQQELDKLSAKINFLVESMKKRQKRIFGD